MVQVYKLIQSKMFSNPPNVVWMAGIIACLAFTGCRQRAYTELYVENMASDIRVLEDRVYEYDAAYQSLESENAEQKRINASLEAKLRDLRYESDSSSRSSTPSLKIPPKIKSKPEPYLLPEDTRDIEPVLEPILEPIMEPAKKPKANAAPEIIEAAPVEAPPEVSRSPLLPPARNTPPTATAPSSLPSFGTPPTLDLPAPSAPANQTAPAEILPILPTPDPQAFELRKGRKSKTKEFPEDSLVEQFDLPQSMLSNGGKPKSNTPALPVGTTLPANTLPATSLPANTSNPPVLLPPPGLNPNGNPLGRNQQNKIKMPEGSRVQWASANEPIQPAKQDTTPEKVIEIGFHPSMCRGHNFDSTPGDDGLYLVITPLNEAGKVVNESGVLTIVVEEDGHNSDGANNPNSQARIAAWELSPEQLKETLEPIGTAQGFHLSLPWSENKPEGQIVTVYLRFKTEDGRTFVSRRNILLRKQSQGQSVWSPR